MKTYYFNNGPVRGNCGHKHRTISGLEQCLNTELKVTRSLGGGAYSDRMPYEWKDTAINIMATECGDDNKVIVTGMVYYQ